MSAASTLRQRVPVDKVKGAKQAAPASDSSDSGDELLTYGDYPPFTPPTFTIKEILGAIPAHCFERSALISFGYVARDFALVAALMYAASFIEPALGFEGQVLNGYPGLAAKWAAWSTYWIWAGFVYTGIWILAHECGHQAFSTSKTLNNTMGLILHSFVLVPYHSWRISHAKHHAATGHMSRDEVFVPATRSQKCANEGKGTGRKVMIGGMELEELFDDSPLYRLYGLFVQQLFGWPAYLFNNASGQDWYPKGTNHFDPNSLIFDARHRQQILISDAALLTMGALLTAFGHYAGGISAVGKYYFVPYLMVNHWLVFITYLQHTDPMLPHYRAGEWNFQRGALCTIDRNLMWFVGPLLMHGITETHVAHHICSKIPHHHAWEATEALKEFLGEHYVSTDENMWVSLWKSYRQCRFVEDEGEVVFYKDQYGRTSRQVVYESLPSDSGVDVN